MLCLALYMYWLVYVFKNPLKGEANRVPLPSLSTVIPSKPNSYRSRFLHISFCLGEVYLSTGHISWRAAAVNTITGERGVWPLRHRASAVWHK